MAMQGFKGSDRDDGARNAVRESAHALSGSSADYTRLVELIGDARFALIGEASHGTHEFYHERAELTKRLIEERGYTAVAVEADWPDAYRVNRYVRGASDDRDANAALSGFKRFPAWMWRNTVVRDFVEWLREHNAGVPPEKQAGFYGIDLYSLYTSIEAVLGYLDKVDPEAAQRARYRYSCFEHFGENTQTYGYAAAFGMDETCERQVVQQLVEMAHVAGEAAQREGRGEPDERFHAEQNARLVKNAEQYYRTMFRGHVSSWNLRDRHMVETIQALDAHLGGSGTPPRIAVWAHNSHLGDASATEMGEAGEWNVGELMRKAYGTASVLIGFSTHHGSVTAAADWGGPAEQKRVRPGLHGSFEQLFHDTGPERFVLALRSPHTGPLNARRLQRAIGVIYLPESERRSHYFHTHLVEQFDVMVHLDVTRALEPLERAAGWLTEEAPETYPSGV